MFPLTKNDWYQKRDDRTKRVDTTGFESFSLDVIVSPRIKSSYSIQVMTVTSLNMLARWCRKIRVQIPDAKSFLLNSLDEKIEKILQKELPRIDPYGEFAFGNIEADEYGQILFIGSPEQKIEQPNDRAVWIDSSGWIAGVGSGTPADTIKKDSSRNPVGPAFASCLGVAELFRRAVGMPASLNKRSWYSMYDYSKINDPNEGVSASYVPRFDFGRIHQVGCGAVGSSLDFLLSLTDWRAELHLIDYDKIEVSNCNRSLTFTANDAVNCRKKIDSCADILKGNITPVKFDGSYGDFVKAGRFLDFPADLILCLANEQNVWATIQSNIPPLTFHVTTTPNWAINFGRHIPKKEWCIMCRFSKDIDHHFTPPCSEGEIKNPGKAIVGVLPFLSTTAASLILAEMAKIQLPDYPVNNDFVAYSAKTAGSDFLQLQIKADDGCDCTMQPILRHLTNSKFWSLSTK